MNRNIWRKILFPQKQLQLKATLTGGQSFRWKQASLELKDSKKEKQSNDEAYIGVMGNCVWLLRQNDDSLFYKVLGEIKPSETNKSNFHKIRLKIDYPMSETSFRITDGQCFYTEEYYEALLKSYFRLDIDLLEYYEKWSKAHTHFRNEAAQFYAVRVLNQDPIENLFSFICSQNNHISRISSLVEKLCTNYGEKICEAGGQVYYNFPDVHALADPAVEQHLRKESFGYRAKYIQKSASEIIEKGGLEWFSGIQKMDYKDAHRELISLTGIGPKVADCICLMSLDHLSAIPVDTHVFKIASDHYLPSIRNAKSVTTKIYTEIGDKFRDVYGSYAGWAQTVLFCADLKKFKETPLADANAPSKPKKRKK